jgi:PAS domain S-box-containing protein
VTGRDRRDASPPPAPDPLGAPAAAQPAPRERVPWWYFLAFLAVTSLVVLAVWYHLEDERQGLTALWHERVATIADDRVRFVESWLAARRGDAEVLATSPAARAAVRGGGPADALARQLDQVRAAYGYTHIWVFDAHGRLVAPATTSAAPRAALAEAAAVRETRETRIDLIDEASDRRVLYISMPILDGAGAGASPSESSRVVGVVTLAMAPETSLYPLLSEETVSTKTGETLLFRIDTGDGSYLSPIRHGPASPTAITRSLQAVRALDATAPSTEDVGELLDYRDEPAFAAIRRVAPTSWGLLFKVDKTEALTEFRRAGQLAGLAAAFLLLAFAGLLISLWRQRQRASWRRAQRDQARAIVDLRGYAEAIVASIPSGLLLLGDDLRVLSVNPAFLDAFHLHEGDVIGRDVDQVMRAPGLLPRARNVLDTGVAQRDLVLDLAFRQRQETRPVQVTMTRIRLADDDTARLLMIVQDLSEEKRLQAARHTSEQRFRDLVQGLDAIVWEADATTLVFSFVSQRAEAVLGYPVERWREPDFFATRLAPDDRDRVMRACREAAAQGADYELEYRALTAEGLLVWLRDIVHVRRGPSGRAIQLRGVTVDLTEQKRAEEALHQTEEQLRQVQKMDAVGKLAGGIAHDFNNLLMVIRGDSDLILRRLTPEHPLRANAEGIREAADQAATLTRQLLAFGRKQVLAPAVLDINRVVEGVRKMLERLIGELIDLVTVTAPDLGAVKADPGQIEQMLLNLAVNARDAMPDGGRLTIRTANSAVNEADAARAGVKPGPYVVLEVQDTGVGIDPELKAHLFEPFFTTKDRGKGTGLGLSTVYGIVNQSGGHIRVDSGPGKGTTFSVFLPRVEATPIDDAGAEDFASSLGGSNAELHRARRETILLVEDAERVRAVVREILEMQGYEVIEARDGAEAMKLSSLHPAPIHLMVTDVVMPEMSGRELAQRLAPIRPDMKVLYISGYPDDAIVRHGVLGAGMTLLAKPFTPDALTAKVREMLDASRRNVAQARN